MRKHDNFCSTVQYFAVQDMGERRRLSLPRGCAPGNGCGFDPFVVFANQSTAQVGPKKTNLAWLTKSAIDRKMRSSLDKI